MHIRRTKVRVPKKYPIENQKESIGSEEQRDGGWMEWKDREESQKINEDRSIFNPQTICSGCNLEWGNNFRSEQR